MMWSETHVYHTENGASQSLAVHVRRGDQETQGSVAGKRVGQNKALVNVLLSALFSFSSVTVPSQERKGEVRKCWAFSNLKTR